VTVHHNQFIVQAVMVAHKQTHNVWIVMAHVNHVDKLPFVVQWANKQHVAVMVQVLHGVNANRYLIFY